MNATLTPPKEATSIKESFPVLHMTCASCAASAESITQAAEGVVNASVNFATASLTVEYLPSVTNPLELQKAMQSVGYDLLLEDES